MFTKRLEDLRTREQLLSALINPDILQFSECLLRCFFVPYKIVQEAWFVFVMDFEVVCSLQCPVFQRSVSKC